MASLSTEQDIAILVTISGHVRMLCLTKTGVRAACRHLRVRVIAMPGCGSLNRSIGTAGIPVVGTRSHHPDPALASLRALVTQEIAL